MTPVAATDTLTAILPPTRAWPLCDSATTRALEARALAGQPPHTLMARAGLAVARLAVATQPGARSVLALAGPGNNGGDAVVAASELRRCGWQAQIVLLGDAARLPPDAAWALARAQAEGLPLRTTLPDVSQADLLLDGLLGLGARRAPEGALADAVRWLNRSRRPVLAIDLPTGLDGDRGSLLGEQAVRATHTLSLLTLKSGLFTAEGRDHAGRVWLDSLGQALPTPSTMTLTGPGDADARAPHASHKGRFGDVLVLGGAAGMVGAARLAARAALAAGAGRVYLSLLDPDAPRHDDDAPELMHRTLAGQLDAAALAGRSVVCGCGGGDAVGALLPPLLAHAARLVLDADALNAVAGDSALQQALSARGRRGGATILTPHPLEAARLLGQSAQEVQADRPAAARALAARFGALVVLKGSGTIVALPDGTLFVNPTGNALLATAGSGDVLAGWMAGAWARAGDAPAVQVAIAAVFRHGLAADLAARGGHALSLRASALPEAMRCAAGTPPADAR